MSKSRLWVSALLLLLAIAGLLVGISIIAQPGQTALGTLLIVGAGILAAAQFVSGLNDAVDLVRKLRDQPVPAPTQEPDKPNNPASTPIANVAAGPEKIELSPAERVFGSPPQGINQLFRDRHNEIGEINRLLVAQQTDIRLILIYGKGGSGKTALACKVMKDLEDNSPEFKLIYLSTRSRLGISLEQVFVGSAAVLPKGLGQKIKATWTNPDLESNAKIELLLEAYRQYRFVILFDNLETLQDAQGNLIDADLRQFVYLFLKMGHNSKLLVTTREPLGVTDDVRLYIQPFPLDDGLPHDDAIGLLMDFDRDGRLRLRSADNAALDSVVEKTLGFPRALEAVAGILDRDPLLSLKSLLNTTTVFEGEVVERLIREAQSKLDKDDTRVMEALAVFDRPVTEEALQFLLAPYFETLDVRQILRRLARGRYVTIQEATYLISVHPLDRTYNYQQIPEDETRPYNLRALERRAAQYYSGQRTEAQTWKEIGDLEPQLIEFEHLMKGNAFDEAARLVTEIDQAYLARWGYAQRVLAMREALLGKISNSKLQAENLSRCGVLSYHLGSFQRALEYGKDAIAKAHEADDIRQEIISLVNIGKTYQYLGQFVVAAEYKHHALELAEGISDTELYTDALMSLGSTYLGRGMHEQALEHYRRAIRMFNQKKDRVSKAMCLNNMGEVYRMLIGNNKVAFGCYSKALSIARELKQRKSECIRLGNLGEVHAEAGRYDIAIRYYTESLQIARDILATRSEAIRLTSLGSVLADLGEYDRALNHLNEALRLVRQMGARNLEGDALTGISSVMLRQERYENALSYLSQALSIAGEIQSSAQQEHVSLQIALIQLFQNHPEDAVKYIEIAKGHSIPKYNHRLILLEGLTDLALKRLSEAEALFHQSIEHSDQLLARTPDLFFPKFTRAHAFAALSILSQDSTTSSCLLEQAASSYRSATDNCSGKGVISENYNLLRLLGCLSGSQIPASLEDLIKPH